MSSSSTPDSKTRKRAHAEESGNGNSAPKKSRSSAIGKSVKGKDRAGVQAQGIPPTEWPQYYQSLLRVYKALNTVLAFCAARQHMAITFESIRASVENMLRGPLDLKQIAEIKAILPDVINFAYTPKNYLRVHDESKLGNEKRTRSPDFSAFTKAKAQALDAPADDDNEHVLVLEFIDSTRGKKQTGSSFTLPPTMTPAATKKLVERRNARFVQAVSELLQATPHGEDPVQILQAAAREHIPVDPYEKGKSSKVTDSAQLPVPEPQDRPSITEVISEIEQQSWYSDQISYRRTFEAKEGEIDKLDPPLSSTIKQALKTARNIDELYTHQVAAITALSQRQHVIVSTSTASGKSVIYQVPLMRFLEEDPSAKAILIYPTKALAQDQRAALEQLLVACPGLERIKVATYDGDTPQDMRRTIRETASVIFTNFDMIHASVLPHEDLWRPFLKNLKLVAIDELHYYSALFGSHVAMVMRRLRRICAAVGNRRSLFVSCSATISSPLQHMKNILGVDDAVVVTQDGAPSGQKDFIAWYPPLKDPIDPAVGRKSPMAEATALMTYLMKRGVRVILFCKIRKVCELAMKTLRAELSAEGRLDVLKRVMSYRGGYSQEDRRKIEREAFSGSLLGIVATNALELGVDIGVLDAVIMLGFPVTLASFRQQSGRAGRRARDSLAVLVGSDYPLDQHYITYPDELFDKPTKDLIIDISNKVILEAHLHCAAQEMPLCKDDASYFGPLCVEVCEEKLSKDKDGWYHPHPKFLPFPASHVSIRGAEEERYCVVDITKLLHRNGVATILEEVEISRAIFELYEGGVFIHQGLTFLVKEVNHDSKMAKLIRSDVNWVTEPRDFTNCDAVKTYRVREIKGSSQRVFFGRVDIKTVVFGYFKLQNKKILDAVNIDTPPWERETTGFWIDIPKNVLDMMRYKGINLAESIHAAQHAFLNRFGMAADVKTECKVAKKEYGIKQTSRKRPARLIFYDSVGKTGSVSVRAFDHVSEVLRNALQATESCECEDGCVDCVKSSTCKENSLIEWDEITPVAIVDNYGMDILENSVIEAQGVGAVEGIFVEADTS